MNFLAHLWLADRTGTSLAGSVLGDFVHGRISEDYSADLARGVALHRRIDASTDRHPLSIAARAQFANGQRRYAGILLDVIHDHLLAVQWPAYSSEHLGNFITRAAQDVARTGDWFVRAGGRAPGQLEFEALLHSYASEAGIDRAIQRTAQRMRDPQGLLSAAAAWPHLAQSLATGLPELLGDLRDSAQIFVDDCAAVERAGGGPR